MIAACTAMFLWQQSLDITTGRRAIIGLGAIPAVLLTDAWYCCRYFFTALRVPAMLLLPLWFAVQW